MDIYAHFILKLPLGTQLAKSSPLPRIQLFSLLYMPFLGSIKTLLMRLHRKALEKVILAEITKRETQSSETSSHIMAVQEQLRVALSSLQQAIGGVQFQVSKDKEQFSNDVSASDENILGSIRSSYCFSCLGKVENK